jgi:hypothetical protein
MAPFEIPSPGIAQAAGRILIAWRSGESAQLERELEKARCLAQIPLSSTFEMERMEVLAGAVESLRARRGRRPGVVRLLEHLAKAEPRQLTRLAANG